MVSFRPRLGIEDTRRVLSRVRRFGLALMGVLALVCPSPLGTHRWGEASAEPFASPQFAASSVHAPTAPQSVALPPPTHRWGEASAEPLVSPQIAASSVPTPTAPQNVALPNPAPRLEEASPGPESLLVHWLKTQEGLESWSADLLQTRRLPSLTRPLTAPGKVWFTAPNQFRWELGQPAQSIAVRDGAELLILSPRLKRGERYPLGQLAQGPMKEALALLDSGFPRNAADFQSRFELLSVSNAPPAVGFQVRPRSAGTRELMPGLRLWVETNTWQLQATELHFADGSSLRNDFTNAVRNPTNPANLFRPLLDASWKVTEMAPPAR